MQYSSRLRRLRAKMAGATIPSLVVTHLPDVAYLCGFTGSNAALAITAKRATLFTDSRYTTQAKEEAQGVRVVIAKKSALLEAVASMVEAGAAHVFFDGAAISVGTLELMHSDLAERLKQSKQSARHLLRALKQSLVADLRLIKDEEELELMREAAALGDSLFEQILPFIEPGVTEVEVAARLEHAARMAGAEAMSFPTIVASGSRSALPHGTASRSKLPRQGFVTLDFGVILRGYCSDMTRTVHIGKATDEERSAYEAVQTAQEEGVRVVKAGVSCGDVDTACRSVLEKQKLGKFFTHSTGHGVGLEIHEQPRIAKGQGALLEAGMVITIEPGVYLPGRFGIRIEDTVSVTTQGAGILTKSTKAWIQM